MPTNSDPGPADQVAAWFMERKGYVDAQPQTVTQLAGQLCWYYSYDLVGEGMLELEVSWNERKQDWDTLVTTFNIYV